MIHKIFIDGKEVTEEQAREIIMQTPKELTVKVHGYTEFTSTIDGLTYVRYYDKVYKGRRA